MASADHVAVFVPSIVNSDDVQEGLGIYSTEQKALDVLRDTLRARTAERLKDAQIVLWVLDEAKTPSIPLKHMLAHRCPVCRQPAFWIDAIEMNALCYVRSCQAWVEHSDIETDKVDCGWPPIGFTSQSADLDEALQILKVYGAKMRGSGTMAKEEEAGDLFDEWKQELGDATSIQ